MTASSTIEAASDGGTTTGKDVPAQRVHGVDRLREEECYHLTLLVEQCLRETEHLVRKVNSKAQARTADYDGSKGTKPLDRNELAAILHDAYTCASLALTYIYSAATHLREKTETPDDPWVSEPVF